MERVEAAFRKMRKKMRENRLSMDIFTEKACKKIKGGGIIILWLSAEVSDWTQDALRKTEERRERFG